MGLTEDEGHTSISFAEAAKTNPATYLSTNPIHCLRSKYILKHNPPQVFYAPGKEELAKTNPSIGAFYEFHGAEKLLDQQEEEVREAVAETSKRVQEAVHREDVALEKLKAATTARAEAASETHKAAAGRGEIEKTVKVLELHMEGNQKLLELEQKKKEAAEALEAAKKAAEEAKKREKELAEESKAALQEQKTKASETLKYELRDF
eukprot:s293_g8.t2